MCPVCLATAAIIAGSATGTGGLTALVVNTFAESPTLTFQRSSRRRIQIDMSPTIADHPRQFPTRRGLKLALRISRDFREQSAGEEACLPGNSRTSTGRVLPGRRHISSRNHDGVAAPTADGRIWGTRGEPTCPRAISEILKSPYSLTAFRRSCQSGAAVRSLKPGWSIPIWRS